MLALMLLMLMVILLKPILLKPYQIYNVLLLRCDSFFHCCVFFFLETRPL